MNIFKMLFKNVFDKLYKLPIGVSLSILGLEGMLLGILVYLKYYSFI